MIDALAEALVDVSEKLQMPPTARARGGVGGTLLFADEQPKESAGGAARVC